MANSLYSWQKKHLDLSDIELIALYKSSDNKELVAILFNRYLDLLYGLCLKHLKDGAEATDTCYEVFEMLIPKLIQHDVTNFKSWLYRLTTNYCIDKLRKRKNHNVISLDNLPFETIDMSMEMIDNMQEKELVLQKINQCMLTLNPNQRESVDLFFFHEKSYNEIASQLNISWDQTRSLIQNGKRNLKLCMEQNQ